MITFEVHGTPVPQAGMRAVPTAGGVRLVTAGGLGLRVWRNLVTQNAAATLATFTGPVTVECQFRFPMPQSRSKRDRADGQLWKTTSPDLDKLCRAVGDSLTASGMIGDDKQIVRWDASKIETVEWTGALITVAEAYPLDPVTRG